MAKSILRVGNNLIMHNHVYRLHSTISGKPIIMTKREAQKTAKTFRDRGDKLSRVIAATDGNKSGYVVYWAYKDKYLR